MVRELIFLQGSSNVLEVQKLKNKVTDTYLDAAATVEVTLLDPSGAPVAGSTWPVALAYVAASEGLFRGILPPAVAVVAGEWYEVQLNITSGSLSSVRRIPLRAVDA